MKTNFYLYKAVVVSVYDGDTIRCDVDLGFNTWIRNMTLRLYGIDSPEIRGEERPQGLKARDWLREELPVGTEVLIETIRDRTGKYGRYLAVVWKDGTDMNKKMIRKGYAEPYPK